MVFLKLGEKLIYGWNISIFFDLALVESVISTIYGDPQTDERNKSHGVVLTILINASFYFWPEPLLSKQKNHLVLTVLKNCVNFETRLQFHCHANKMNTESYRSLGLSKRITWHFNATTKPLVYDLLVRPKPKYTTIIWSHYRFFFIHALTRPRKDFGGIFILFSTKLVPIWSVLSV